MNAKITTQHACNYTNKPQRSQIKCVEVFMHALNVGNHWEQMKWLKINMVKLVEVSIEREMATWCQVTCSRCDRWKKQWWCFKKGDMDEERFWPPGNLSFWFIKIVNKCRVLHFETSKWWRWLDIWLENTYSM